MTEEDRKLLKENNLMLKVIVNYIANQNSDNNDIKNFIINVLANGVIR